jgi:hypothetical protein
MSRESDASSELLVWAKLSQTPEKQEARKAPWAKKPGTLPD